MSSLTVNGTLQYYVGSNDGGSAKSGQARSGYYDGKLYSGRMIFNLASMGDLSNANISKITLKLTIGSLGGVYDKKLYLRHSGRGTAVGTYTLTSARNTTKTLVFANGSNTEGFGRLKSYLEGLSGTTAYLGIISHTPGSRDSGYSGSGYDWDYMNITSASITLEYGFKMSTGSIDSSMNTGSNAVLKIYPGSYSYVHKVTWRLESWTATHSLYAGTGITGTSTTATVFSGSGVSSAKVDDEYVNTSTFKIYKCTVAGAPSAAKWVYISAGYGCSAFIKTIPHSALPNSTKGTATVTLETLDGSTSLGSTNYTFTANVPTSVVPVIGTLSLTRGNNGASTAAYNWGLYIQGKTKVTVTIGNISGLEGATIKSYSITNNKGYAASSASSYTTGALTATGDTIFYAKVTDSRGRTSAQKQSSTIYVYAYSAPAITGTDVYRCDSNGNRKDTDGKYAQIKVNYTYSSVNNKNSLSTRSILINNVTTSNIESGTYYKVGNDQLLTTSTYTATVTLTDAVGSTTTYNITVPSASYIFHIKNGGTALGIGQAAGNDNTLGIKWATTINNTLNVNNNAVIQNGILKVKENGNASDNRAYIQIMPDVDGKADLTFGRSGIATWAWSSRESASAFFGLFNHIRGAGTWPIKVAEATDVVTLSQPLPIGSGGTGASSISAAMNSLAVSMYFNGDYSTFASIYPKLASIPSGYSGMVWLHPTPARLLSNNVIPASTYVSGVVARTSGTGFRLFMLTDKGVTYIWTVSGWTDASTTPTIGNVYTNAYSTTEQVVGVWTDAKPIYRITFINNSVTGTGTQTIGSLPRTPSTIVNVYGSYLNAASDLHRVIPFYASTGYFVGVGVTSGKVVQCTFGSSMNDTKKVRLTVEYTA